MATELQNQLAQILQDIYPMHAVHALEIAEQFNEKSLKKHEYLLQEGRVANDYYILHEGYVRAFSYDLDGNDITTAFYTPGKIVCELFSFFKRLPSQENLQALTDLRVSFISFDQLQEVFHGMPQFREMGRTILINAYAGLKQRMLSTLNQTSEQRYQHLINSQPGVFQHASLKNISSYLGITDTSLSRIRRQFAKQD